VVYKLSIEKGIYTLILKYNPLFEEKILEDIYNHAKDIWPNESCGYISNNKYIPCVNDAIDPENSFVITNSTFDKALINKEVQAVIHSHNSRPYASAFDQMKCDDMEVPFGIINLVDPNIVTHIVFWGRGIKRAPLEGRFFFFGVFDCLSLVVDHYKNKYRIKLPDPHRDISFIDGNRKFFEEYLDELFQTFERVDLDDLEQDDILFYFHGGRIIHTGFYYGDNQVMGHWLNQKSGLHSIEYKKELLKLAVRKK